MDTTFTILGFNKKVGKYLVVADQDVTPFNMPALFRGKNWAVIPNGKMEAEYADEQYQYISDSIGMNFLMVTPELAIISDRQTTLKKTLEFYGIKVLPLTNKHTKQMAGGFHCSTNEINREDVHGFSRILETPKA